SKSSTSFDCWTITRPDSSLTSLHPTMNSTFDLVLSTDYNEERALDDLKKSLKLGKKKSDKEKKPKSNTVRVNWFENDGSQVGSIDLCREMISLHSSFFRSFLYSKRWGESRDEIDIASTPLVKFKDFENLCEYLVSPFAEIKGEMAYSILKAADYFIGEGVRERLVEILADHIENTEGVNDSAIEEIRKMSELLELGSIRYLIKRLDQQNKEEEEKRAKKEAEKVSLEELNSELNAVP
ncbi:hypothetical protein PFISCL1PPCAC_8190, partial [Pristionchus fissidentatus]